MSQRAIELIDDEKIVSISEDGRGGRFLEHSKRFYIEVREGTAYVLDADNEYNDVLQTPASRPDREILFGAETYIHAKDRFFDLGVSYGRDQLARDLNRLLGR
jgi:hypothetical protein